VSVEHRVFSDRLLLEIPTKRAAWSDRTVLLMAEMSKLAYYQFETDTAGNVIPQADLDVVLERLISSGGEAVSDSPTDAQEADELPALPEDAVRLKDDLVKAGFELVGLFSHRRTDTQAFLAISTSDSGSDIRPFGDEQVAILSFRGTKTVKDWLNNVKFLQKKVEGAAVHRGFQGAFDALEPAIRKKLDPLVEGGRTLYLTGHSLGGRWP